jgi:hypothetical protein
MPINGYGNGNGNGAPDPYATDTKVDGLFDFDLGGVNLTLEGFWDDFSLLGEGSGFPFK